MGQGPSLATPYFPPFPGEGCVPGGVVAVVVVVDVVDVVDAVEELEAEVEDDEARRR